MKLDPVDRFGRGPCRWLLGLAALWLGCSTLSLSACGGETESPGNDAESEAAAAIQILSGGARGAAAADPDTSDEAVADFARALLGGVVAAVTGAGGECLELAVAARRGTAPQLKAADPDSARIPLVAGLRIIYAVSKDGRDHENSVEVTGTDEKGVSLRLHSARASADGGEARSGTVDRRVLWEDLDAARCFAVAYTGDPSVGGPGLTWLSLSRALLAELRARGVVAFGLANEPVPDARSATFVGDLRVVETGTFTLTLDDSLVQVPSLVLRADLRHKEHEKEVELEIMDDPDFPLELRVCCERSSDRVVRIERRRERRIERALAETGEAIVYGINFDFGSADLRDDSEPVLEEIADALRAHPDWHLRVEGHTDAIGDADSNLLLSRARADAVKEELVRRLGPELADRLVTGGYGESRPRADNETLEGRAANRRVELIRSRS